MNKILQNNDLLTLVILSVICVIAMYDIILIIRKLGNDEPIIFPDESNPIPMPPMCGDLNYKAVRNGDIVEGQPGQILIIKE